MQKFDAPVLAANLNALCAVFDRKPIAEQALAVWFDALREFPTELVMDAVLVWPKYNSKFPAPADIVKLANDRSSRMRERKAEIEKKEFHPGVGGAKAKEFLAKIKHMLEGPTSTPKEHWERVLATAPRGSIGYQYATQALKKWAPMKPREPGEDDDSPIF